MTATAETWQHPDHLRPGDVVLTCTAGWGRVVGPPLVTHSPGRSSMVVVPVDIGLGAPRRLLYPAATQLRVRRAP